MRVCMTNDQVATLIHPRNEDEIYLSEMVAI